MLYEVITKEIMNPGALAAIKRMKNYGLTIKSQSPIMNSISLFKDESGKVDVDRSAQNWIDLGVITSYSIHYTKLYDGKNQQYQPPGVFLVLFLLWLYSCCRH